MKAFKNTIKTIGLLSFTLLISCNEKNEFGVYTTLQGSDKLENIENKLTWDIPTAHYNAISPNGQYMLVSSISEPSAHLIDLYKNELLKTFEVGSTPQGVAISPNNRWGIAVCQDENSISFIDIKNLTKVKTIAIGKVPHNVIFTKDGQMAYVTLQGEGKIAVVNMKTQEKVDEYVVKGMDTPDNLDITADEKTLWIRDFIGNVAAFDLQSKEVLAIIPVSKGHSGIDIISSENYVFAGGIVDKTVDVIDPKTYEVIKKIEVGQGSHGVRSNKDGDLVYISVTGTGKIAVIDTQTLEVKEYIDTQGDFPFWVAVSDNPQ